jgi:hypothetical protein
MSGTTEYIRNHRRVHKKYGSASDYQCLLCFDPARDWAHMHGTDPADPDNYEPMCKTDHNDYDFDIRSANGTANLRKLWADPAFRARNTERIRAERLADWSDPEYRSRMSGHIREWRIRPDVNERINANNRTKMKQNWQDPDFRARCTGGMPMSERAMLSLASRLSAAGKTLVPPVSKMTEDTFRLHMAKRHAGRAVSSEAHASHHKKHSQDHAHVAVNRDGE